MQICMNCKKEMICSKNGVTAVWHGQHCYTGDAYKCKECGAEVLVTNRDAYHNPNALYGVSSYTIDMTGE